MILNACQRRIFPIIGSRKFSEIFRQMELKKTNQLEPSSKKIRKVPLDSKKNEKNPKKLKLFSIDKKLIETKK